MDEIADNSLLPPQPYVRGVMPDTVCAGFGIRFIAQLIDLVVRFPVIFAIGVIFVDDRLLYQVAACLDLVYFTYFWTDSGASPGKRIMGLKVVDRHGELLDIRSALIRYTGTWISAIPLFLGYFWAIWDAKHETWHDKIGGTKVVRVR
jgi:uncharacterized RDD family membrane protein YckC